MKPMYDALNDNFKLTTNQKFCTITPTEELPAESDAYLNFVFFLTRIQQKTKQILKENIIDCSNVIRHLFGNTSMMLVFTIPIKTF